MSNRKETSNLFSRILRKEYIIVSDNIHISCLDWYASDLKLLKWHISDSLT